MKFIICLSILVISSMALSAATVSPRNQFSENFKNECVMAKIELCEDSELTIPTRPVGAVLPYEDDLFFRFNKDHSTLSVSFRKSSPEDFHFLFVAAPDMNLEKPEFQQLYYLKKVKCSRSQKDRYEITGLRHISCNFPASSGYFEKREILENIPNYWPINKE